MNIFKPYYKIVVAALKTYCKLETRKNASCEFAEDVCFDKINAKQDFIINVREQQLWHELIRKYINKFTNEEEKKFLELKYFKNEKAVKVECECYIEKRTMQDWREEQFKNIILLAMQERLINIEYD